MFFELFSPPQTDPTEHTFKLFSVGFMGFHMALQVVISTEFLIAFGALKVSLFFVEMFDVPRNLPRLAVPLVAEWTFEWFLPGMRSKVLFR